MTSCHWPRRSGWLNRLHDWWTPPVRSLRPRVSAIETEQDRNREELWENLMGGGIWLS